MKFRSYVIVKISELHSFHCGMELRKVINDELSKSCFSLTVIKLVKSPIEKLAYRAKQENMYVCGWCAKDLKRSDCLKLEKTKSLYSKVIPNCKGCVFWSESRRCGWLENETGDISAKIEAKETDERPDPTPQEKKKKDCVEVLDSD